MFLLRLAVCGDHSAKDLHITGGEACVSCGDYKDGSQSACALQAVLDGNVSGATRRS